MARNRSAGPTLQTPGQYVRDTVLAPKKMSVTETAKVLGVGRPALSNFLNGKAAASPDMATRLERAFGIPAQKILDLQAACDAAEAKMRGAPADVKTYVPPFLAIKANEIENWAASNISARTRLSVFLRTLVHSTGIGLVKVDFPGNDDAERAGWDGYVEAAEGMPWIPAGSSGWEFGTNEKIKEKADGDYSQRTKRTDKDVREQTTFIFVTPRPWTAKKKWEKQRQDEKQWKNVLAYDASDLEQWLEQSIAAQAWFACETHRASNGTQSLDKCCEDWANAATPPLVDTLFSSAVSTATRLISSRLSKPPEEPIIVAADSTEEGLAFLSCLFSETEAGLAAFRDRVVVFRETGVLPKLAIGSSNVIAVVANREVERELAPFCNSIHSIVVYPRNVVNAEPHVVLEPLNYEAFRTSLETMNFNRDDIDRLGRESGRSLTVLRRRLSRVPAISAPEWAADPARAAQLVPFLFAGAWNSKRESDQIILSLLAGKKDYAVLENEFQALTRLNDTAVWSVGTYRGVISKIDLLFAIASSVTELKTYFDVAHLVLSEKDPSLDLPEEDQWAAGIYGKTREISGALREGISETLVLLAVHGNALFQERLGINVEAFVARLVKKLLTPLTTRTLEEQERDLPTYAEACPNEFLSIIEEDLRSKNPASSGLMRPVNSGTFGRCIRAGLLWALENLAWSPTTLPRVVMILAKLAKIQIDDNWVNKPIGSLESIFRCWMPQTAANLDQRITLMQKLAEEHPNIAWHICMEQFPTHHRTGHYSHKPRWRNDGQGFGEPVRREEMVTFEVKMIDLALNWKMYDRKTLGDLISRIYALDRLRQTTVWDLVKRWADGGASDADKAWVREKIRVTIMSRRGAVRKATKQDENLIASAHEAYQALEPRDLLNKHEWLFRESWVEESMEEKELDEMDFQKRDERITNLRITALREILEEHGIEGVLNFAELGNTAYEIGWLMTRILLKDQTIEFIVTSMPPGTDSWTRNKLIQGVLHALEDEMGSYVLRAVGQARSELDFSKILCLAPFNAATWVLVDELDEVAQGSYWASVLPTWARQSDHDLNEAVERLLKVKRPRAAFSCVHFELKKLRPSLLFRLLNEMATINDEPEGHYPPESYYITKAFNLLDASKEFSVEQLAGLEFPYIEVLSRNYGERGARGIPNLELYLEDHPEFFAEAIAWTYKRDDDGNDPVGLKLDDPELVKHRAELGWRLLDNLERIPGRNNLGEIDPAFLLAWIKTVRKSSSDLGRLSVCDISLGNLLSSAPEGTDGVWPCEPVRDVLEKIQSLDISQGITTGLYNARGAHWRGEGGDQEREIAIKYQKWATALEFSHPFVATSILKHMAHTYEQEAKGQDTEAKIRRRLR